MKIKILVEKHDIISAIQRNYIDHEVTAHSTFEELEQSLSNGDEADVIILSNTIIAPRFKEYINVLCDKIQLSFRIIVINLNKDELDSITCNYLISKGIYDFSVEPTSKASILFSLIDKPKTRKDVLDLIDSDYSSTDSVEKEIVVEKIVKIKSSGIVSFVGIPNTGMTTAALYFSKRLAETLAYLGDAHSRVLLVDLNTSNPKARHYLKISEPNLSIEKMALLINEKKSENLNAMNFVQQPIKKIPNLYFLDGMFNIFEQNDIGEFEIKYILDHLRNLFDYIVLVTNGNVNNVFTNTAYKYSNHAFINLDMNFANLDRIKKHLHYIKYQGVNHLVFNKYKPVNKYDPEQYADALDIKSHFIIPYNDLLVDYSNDGKFLDEDSYNEAIDKLVSIFVQRPKENKKKRLSFFRRSK